MNFTKIWNSPIETIKDGDLKISKMSVEWYIPKCAQIKSDCNKQPLGVVLEKKCPCNIC